MKINQKAPLQRCEICQGTGVWQGVFGDSECAACNGGGVVKQGGSPLEHRDLVRQLRLRLADGFWVEPVKADASAAGRCRDNNQRGPGRSHYTGD